MTDIPTFNLWTKAWIDIEQQDGSTETRSLEQLLLFAHELRALYDPSPLVIVSIHRLLVAILQEIIAPETEEDLTDLWETGRFSADSITQFGRTYANRFDLFDPNVPYMQSADIPLIPAKWGKGKSVGYLLQEQTAGTAVTHYNHLYDRDQQLCSSCAAKGLLLIPAFASSGGAGIKPSINGVPPIYIIPGGTTYFDSLVASLTVPAFQPDVADTHDDKAWWRRASPTIVERGQELLSVGYLHSLTFPARRVRLHPRLMHRPCSRCGMQTMWGVPEMTYAMGESRPKDAAFWQDPFTAYRHKDGVGKPIPIRPVEGRALWREFAGLFLPQKPTRESDKKQIVLLRPRIIDQLETLRSDPLLRAKLPYAENAPIPFQTVGLRTDMKMKIFEWQQSGFQVPPKLLADAGSAELVERALNFAIACDGVIKHVFRRHYGGDGGEELNKQSKQRLSRTYWQTLAPHFSEYVLQAGGDDSQGALTYWLDTTQRTAQNVFKQQVATLGNNADALRRRVEAENHCAAELKKQYKKQTEGEV